MDDKNLASDWQRVGNDIRKDMQATSRAHGEE